jgi:hypothetical protein
MIRCVMNQVRAGFDRAAVTFRDLPDHHWDGLGPVETTVLIRAGLERVPCLCGVVPENIILFIILRVGS